MAKIWIFFAIVRLGVPTTSDEGKDLYRQITFKFNGMIPDSLSLSIDQLGVTINSMPDYADTKLPAQNYCLIEYQCSLIPS